MENKKLIVCSETGIIVNDGVTIYPGYCEVRNGVLKRYDAVDDPHNKEAIKKPWVLHNRIDYMKVVQEKEQKEEALQGKYFMSEKAMQKYLLHSEK